MIRFLLAPHTFNCPESASHAQSSGAPSLESLGLQSLGLQSLGLDGPDLGAARPLAAWFSATRFSMDILTTWEQVCAALAPVDPAPIGPFGTDPALVGPTLAGAAGTPVTGTPVSGAPIYENFEAAFAILEAAITEAEAQQLAAPDRARLRLYLASLHSLYGDAASDEAQETLAQAARIWPEVQQQPLFLALSAELDARLHDDCDDSFPGPVCHIVERLGMYGVERLLMNIVGGEHGLRAGRLQMVERFDGAARGRDLGADDIDRARGCGCLGTSGQPRRAHRDVRRRPRTEAGKSCNRDAASRTPHWHRRRPSPPPGPGRRRPADAAMGWGPGDRRPR